MNTIPFTHRQLDNWFSQPIKDLYFNYLEVQLGEISYQLMEDKLIILIEGTVTQSEHLLQQTHHPELARRVRATINKVIHPQIKRLIEEAMNVNVVDFFSNTTIDTGRTGVMAIFELHSQNSFPDNST